jgi:hypothetical protein
VFFSLTGGHIEEDEDPTDEDLGADDEANRTKREGANA